jgi:hypothetical protein
LKEMSRSRASRFSFAATSSSRVTVVRIKAS